MTMKPGDAIQAPAETPHTTKNTGKTKISFVLVEIAEKKM
jgi:mannose-6-phosphate isomerase-like protein (cupin superfamily)